MTQRNKFKLTAYVFLLVAAIIGLIFIWQANGTKSRDYQRLGDLKLIQQTLADYFFKYNTYRIPGCNPPVAVRFCTGEGERRVNFGRIADPLNNQSHQYTVISLSDDDFEIGFTLETSIAGLAPGEYSYTKNGLRQ